MSRTSDWNLASYGFAEESVLWFDRPNEGRNKFVGSDGDDRIVGTDGGDRFYMTLGGEDIVRGQDGNDTFVFGNTFGTGDRVVGGKGLDTLAVYTTETPVELTGENCVGIEKIRAYGGNLTTIDVSSDVTSASIFTRGLPLSVTIDSSNVNDFSIRGSSGTDFFTSGSGDDVLYGARGRDFLAGGAGDDVFKYKSDSDSTAGRGFDLISDFSVGDIIALPKNISYVIGGDTDKFGNIMISYDETRDITEITVNFDKSGDENFGIDLAGDLSGFSLHNNQLSITLAVDNGL